MSLFAATTWTAIAAVGAVAGAGVAAVGAIQQGKAAEAQAEFQARESQLNAQRAVANAQAEAEANQREQKLLEQRKKSVLASQKSAVAASGLELSGSSLDLMSDTDLNFELQKADSRQGSRLRQYQYLNQSRDFGIESQLRIIAGRNARTSSYYGAGSSLLSGAGQAAGYGGKYAELKGNLS
jgi:hypothetical protein